MPGDYASDRSGNSSLRYPGRGTRRPDCPAVSTGLDAVVFDLGGVLTHSGKPSDVAKRYPDHDPTMIVGLIMGQYHLDTDHPWHRVERGEITLDECRAATRATLQERGIASLGPPIGPLPGESVTAAEPPLEPRPGTSSVVGPNFALNADMMALVADLRAAGLKTGMLTNNVREFRPLWWPLADWPALFDVIVDSHEVGMRKPNPVIYTLTLGRLGVSAERSAFLDDVESNVAAAESVGMTGIVVAEDTTVAIARTRALAGL